MTHVFNKALHSSLRYVKDFSKMLCMIYFPFPFDLAFTWVAQFGTFSSESKNSAIGISEDTRNKVQCFVRCNLTKHWIDDKKKTERDFIY